MMYMKKNVSNYQNKVGYKLHSYIIFSKLRNFNLPYMYVE
jgi:hypothetical protein